MKFIQLFVLAVLFASCVDVNPNQQADELIDDKHRIVENQLEIEDRFTKEVYVPIYSDIYTKSKSTKILLTATLSIRNTSKNDTLYINEVDYYNTTGELVRRYIKEPIFLKPLESLDYVIDEEDETGGSGANFTISWSARKDIKPLFQGVMIGILGQHAFSFTSDAVEIVE